MKADLLLKKLETYEASAYEGACGENWLVGIGEGFKFFVQECIDQNKRITITGFVRKIDEMASKMLVEGDSES
ncbi:hypothetical protein KIH86_24050 [Paenibacillus sp. HN-1]|uniref:hypothetical protein n=1 Tax=Paenibacillus TaxID=44249 RepID=UPI001CA907BC|nr:MULTISPECIES: hypothetical protein [Paenibacillus]MBY9081224.1 hypothetical protein [Paenibacillus sp. CGMCC 1.18879]MBY9087261.1 hypothetical protein [Paenibacillus sinensis]